MTAAVLEHDWARDWVVGPPGWPAHEYMEVLGSKDLRLKSNRVALCRANPILFSLLYFPHRMVTVGDDDKSRVELTSLHVAMGRKAARWSKSKLSPGEIRDAWIAPRDSAKSTWNLGFNTPWALAYEHLRFIAWFGNSGKGSIRKHFDNLIRQFDTNEMLRYDFPELCTPTLRRAGEWTSQSGAILVSRGLDESNLGININDRRPDGLFIDDPEKDEGNHSVRMKEKRLMTFRQAILGMNLRAVVQWMGTTTAYDCLAHDLVRAAPEVNESVAEWVSDLGMQPHYFPVIMVDPNTGLERSLWESRWPLEWCYENRGRHDFELNYMNRPPAIEGAGAYWRPEHFQYGLPDGARIERTILWIDPAVTKGPRSDYTGVCLAALTTDGDVVVLIAGQAKVDPDELAANVRQAKKRYPGLRQVYVEKNQGGMFVARALADIPGLEIHQPYTGKDKETVWGEALVHYQHGRVYHAHQFRVPEDQMMRGPHKGHDDAGDAVSHAVDVLLGHIETAPIATR
jgi:phage terminase large subunit-like protein